MSGKKLRFDLFTLVEWLVENRQADVSVARHLKMVTMRKRSRSVLGSSMDLPQPPWEEPGYTSAEVGGGSSGWTVLGGSAYPWLVGLGLLVALRLMRKRLWAGVQPRADRDKV